MNKFLNKCKKSILLYTFIYFIILFLAKAILNYFNMEFRVWIYDLSYRLFFIGTFLGIIQLIIKLKKIKSIKIVLIIALIVIYFLSYFYITIILAFSGLLPTETIVIENEQKMVVKNESVFIQGKFYYYEYINFIVRENQVIKFETYD